MASSDAGSRTVQVSCLSAICLLVGGFLTVATAAAEELPVDLELLLAVDVSASIDAEEARQQREGYVAAIADPAVIEAIRANFHQRIALSCQRLPPGIVCGGAASAVAGSGSAASTSCSNRARRSPSKQMIDNMKADHRIDRNRCRWSKPHKAMAYPRDLLCHRGQPRAPCR
jgi:hypothetical protein